MKKVMVIGCPGSGKSTFSRELQRITGLPLFHLDMMYWNADRTVVEKPVFLQRLNDAMQCDEWIIDGNYNSTIELRLQACDTVVFLDYPPEVCLEGIMSRRGKPRPDLPWVESENDEDMEFVEFVRNYNTECRPNVIRLIEKYSEREKHIFRDRSEARKYLDTITRTAP